MAENLKGTIVAAGIVPSTTADTYATHYEEYGQGGYRSVTFISDRDSITNNRKKIGMLVYVVENRKTYRLDSMNPDVWTEVESFKQEMEIASQSWWDANKDSMSDEDKAKVYYVPVYKEDVDFYVTTSATDEELFETPYGVYTTDSEEGTAFSPKRYKTDVETGAIDTVYKVDYYKSYQYVGGNWIESTTKGDTSYVLSDDLNVVYSKNYSGYCKALEDAGLSAGDPTSTVDDMTNMKQALDVLYAYLFPADYVDWSFTASPQAPSGDVWTYVNTDTVVDNTTVNVLFNASNKQAQKSYKINKMEVEGVEGDVSNTATTAFTSSVTLPLYEAVATTQNISVVGEATSPRLTVRRNAVANDTVQLKPNAIIDLNSTGNYSISGVLVTQQEGKEVKTQKLEPKSTFTLHALYQKPKDWAVTTASTSSKPYLGHDYSAETSVSVAPNKLSATVTKDGHTVNRNDTDKNLDFFSGGTITLDGETHQLSASSSTYKDEIFTPNIVTAYTSIDHGTKVKVNTTSPYNTDNTYSYTVDTDTKDSVNNKPRVSASTIHVDYQNYDYTNVTDWSSSNVDVKFVLADGSAGEVVNKTTVRGYVGQEISATCECVVSPNTKLDYTEQDIDFEDTDTYKQDWVAVYTSDIAISYKNGQTTLTPQTAYLANKNVYADRNKKASATTELLTFTSSANLQVSVVNIGTVTDVKNSYPKSYTVNPSVEFVKKDWMYFLSDVDTLNSIPSGTKVSGITDLTEVVYPIGEGGYVAYQLPEGIDTKYIYILTTTPIVMNANGLDMTYDGSPWQSKTSDAFVERNGGQSIVLPANSFDKQVSAVNGYYLYCTQQSQSTSAAQIGYIKITGEKVNNNN